MSQQEIAQIELAKTQAVRPTQPDRQPVGHTSVDDLDATLLASFLGAARTSSRRYAAAGEEELLRNTGVVSKSGELAAATESARPPSRTW